VEELIEMGKKEQKRIPQNGMPSLFTIAEINAEFDRRRNIYRAMRDVYAIARYPTI
jgi:hypothetical protein